MDLSSISRWSLIGEGELLIAAMVLLILMAIVAVIGYLRNRRSIGMHSVSEKTRAYAEIVAAMARHPALAKGNVQELARVFFPEITRQAIVDRAGLWLLEGRGPSLICVELYDQRKDLFLSAAQLSATEYQIEINESEGMGKSTFSARDSRLRRYAKRYLKTIGITELLDACIVNETHVQGIVGLECVEHPRQWNEDDEDFIMQVAEIFALALAISRGMDQSRLQKRWIEQGRLLARMLEILQSTKDLPLSAPQALSCLGNGGWADRIALCCNQLDDSGDPGFVIQYNWQKSEENKLFHQQNEWISYNLFAASFRKALMANQVLIAGKNAGDQALQEWLKTRTAQMVQVIPVFLEQEFYGFLFLEKDTTAEADMDRTGYLAALLGGIWAMAIRRNRMHKELTRLQKDLSSAEQNQRMYSGVQWDSAERARQFLADISHRIRTTLNDIVGLSSLPMDDFKRQQHYAQTFRQSSEVLLMQLNELMNYFTVEFHDSPMENMEYDLREAIEDVAELMTLKSHHKPLTISYVVDEGIPLKLRGDSARIRQVLVNLVGQSAMHTEQGEIFIHATVENQNENGLQLRIEINDVIAEKEDVQEEKPAEGANATDMNSRLKVIIAEHLIRQMGGNSGSDKDTHLWFSLWNEFTEDREAAYSSPWTEQIALIADSSPRNRQALASQLKLWGISSLEVANATAAVEMLRQQNSVQKTFGIAFLDRRLVNSIKSKLSGRLSPAQQEWSPALILTGPLYHSHEGKEDAEQMHFAAFLTKPVRRRNLLTILEKNLSTDLNNPERVLEIHSQSGRKIIPHILVAEDNQTNQLVAKAILGNLGCVASIVGNGKAVLDALTKRNYDLVLMDCQMPVLDGYDATRQIRSGLIREIDPGIPIVAMTGKALPGDRERCLECGMDDYISKPIQVNELRAVLDRYTKRNDPARKAVNALFDERELMERLMGDRALGRMVLEGFLEDVPELLERMEERLQENDASGIKPLAQAVITAASNIGARDLMEIATEIKKQSDLDQVYALFAQMQEKFVRLRLELEERFQQW